MFREIGASGLSRWGGHIDEEFHPDLNTHDRRVSAYKEMSANDPTVGAMLFAFEMILREATWMVEPSGDEPEDEAAAEFVRECMHDMSQAWGDFIAEALSMLTYGFAYHEVIYKRRNGPKRDVGESSKFSDGRIGWRKMPIRGQDTLEEWAFDPSGGIQGVRQRDPSTNSVHFVPIQKSLLFRVRARRNNPEGESLLRNAYRPWWFKKHLETIEGIGVERDLAGLPTGYAPPEWFASDATADEKKLLTEMQDVLKRIKRDEQAMLIIPSIFDDQGNRMVDVKLMASGGSREQNVHEIIKRKSQEIAMTILADVILLGHENVGSLALATSKTELLNTALNSILQGVAETINRHELARLFRINGMRGSAKIQPKPIRNVNLEALGNFVQQVSGAGGELFPDDRLENHLRTMAGFPEKEPQL